MSTKRHRTPGGRSSLLSLLIVSALLALTACAGPAAPTPTPTKAATAPGPAAAPKTEAPKPGASPTTAPSKASGAPVKIGYLTPLTGRMAPNGHAQKLAVNMAVDDINNSGGINGSPVKILMEDSAFDPKQAIALTRKLAEQDKVVAILGPYASGEYEVVGPLAVEMKVPVIAGTPTKPGMSAAFRPWGFRITMTDDVSAPAGLDFMKQKYPQVKKLAIVGDTKESNMQNIVVNIYPKLLKDKGFESLGTVDFETTTTDYSAIVTRIKELKPEGLAYASLPGNAIPFAKEAKRQGLSVPLLVGPHLQATPPMEEMDGWFMGGFYDQESTDPTIQKLMGRFKAAAEADSNVAKPVNHSQEIRLYEALLILADGLRKAGINGDSPLDKSRTASRDAFQNLKDYKALSGGVLSMSTEGDVITPPVVLKADVVKKAWVKAQ